MVDQVNRSGDQAGADQADANPWAAAFAALEEHDAEDAEGAAGEPGGGDAPAEEPDAGEPAPVADAGDGGGGEDEAGGSGDEPGVDDAEVPEPDDVDRISLTSEELEAYRTAVADDISNRTLDVVNRSFMKQGVLSHDGIVGAVIDDPRICKRDEDGVPRFFNPETGEEFTGNNPRAQAQAYVESYNKELEAKFNQACETYSRKLAEQEAVGMAVLEFAPKYDAMDPVRKSMFEVLVAPYEITDDSGDVVGYSVDLDDAAARVDQLVETIQSHAPKHEEPHEEPGGPALDMKNSVAVAKQGNREPKSLEEALAMVQDRLLDERKGK